jgi:hypothetical protein
VRGDESACPFCGHAVATCAGCAPRRGARLGRAAIFALGVAAGAAALAGCGDDDSPDPDSGIAAPYGAPPADGIPV